MQFEDLLYEVTDNVATITLNRPDKLNAARASTYDEIVAALELADGDDNVRAVIITANGRAFCAGTDLSDGFRLPMGGDPITGEGVPRDLGGRVTLRLYDMQKPVIGAVNGAAVGFGASFLLAMDIRIAVETARFGFVFSRRGIIAESCSSWFLPRVVGIATASEWMITGRLVGAQEAKDAGLLNKIVAADSLLAEAREIARSIVDETAPVSVAINRQLLWRMMSADHPLVAHELESRGLAERLTSPDSDEGARAFAEKRIPRFPQPPSASGYIQNWWKKNP